MTLPVVNVFSYSTTNVTTSAYVTLLNSTPIAVSKLQIGDSSGEQLKLAVGLAGQEVDICTVPVNGSLVVPIYLIAGQRLSIKSISATASNGYNTVTFLNE